MDKYTDLQFKVFDWLRFPLIVGVVFIHCFGKSFDFNTIDFANLSTMDCYNLFRVGISRVLAHVCVPVFYLISGYLFFIKLEKWDNKVYLNKLKKRCKSLLIPFLVWNSIAITLSLIGTYKHEGMLGIQNFLIENGYWHLYWDCKTWNLDRLNWIGGGASASGPYLIPLWFLRDLMVVCVFSPILYFFFRKLKIYGLLILTMCYISGVFINKPGFSAMAFLFFGAGAYFRLNGIDVTHFSYRYRFLIYTIASILGLVCTMLNGHNTTAGDIVYPFFVISGSFASLNLSTSIVKKEWFKMPPLFSKSSFFVYLLHSILVIKFVSAIALKIFGESNPIFMTISFLFVPVITVAICVAIYYLLNRFMPSLCKVLTGDR